MTPNYFEPSSHAVYSRLSAIFSLDQAITQRGNIICFYPERQFQPVLPAMLFLNQELAGLRLKDNRTSKSSSFMMVFIYHHEQFYFQPQIHFMSYQTRFWLAHV